MKILFLESVQSFGGAQKSTIELITRLKLLGHQVILIDFWGCNSMFLEEVNVSDIELKILDKRTKPFIISNASKVKYLKNIIEYYYIQKKYKKKFKKIIDEFQPDIVNVNSLKCLNILEVNSSYSIDYFARGWFAYKSLSYYTKLKLKKYNPRFLTVSQSTRQAIYTGGIAEFENIIVFTDVINENVFNAYNTDFYEFTENNPIKILHSGGFIKTKGQHICLEIAKKLKDSNVFFKMTLTGVIYEGEESEKYYNSILDLVKEYQLENEVKVVLNPLNILDYFKETDVLIHPSWTEGLPRVSLEALAFGKPVIANPVGGVTDVVIHNFNGFITDFNVVEQYVEYVRRYVENYDLYKQHSISGKELIKVNYLDDNQIESIKRIYPTI